MSTKRKRAATSQQSTPSKRRQFSDADDTAVEFEGSNGLETPSKSGKSTKQTGLSPSKAQINGNHSPHREIPNSTKRSKIETPSKVRFLEAEATDNSNPVQLADRSARKKAAARTIARSLQATASADEVSDRDDELTGKIFSSEEEEAGNVEDQDEENSLQEQDGPQNLITTPKRGRGRPKGSKNKREETPPLDNLPAHEQYFWQNRPGAGLTSNNTLQSHILLNHDEYFTHRQAYNDPHQKQRDFLLELHESAFKQWLFELRNGFNICLYGYGSKRQVIYAFANHILAYSEQAPKMVVVNGYSAALTLKDILSTIAGVLFPKNAKLPQQPAALQALIMETLTEKPPTQQVHVLINSLDANVLRRPAIQSTLAALAGHRKLCLVASVDTPNFPLLWDLSMRRQFRWVYHDATTFVPFDHAEVDVVESVNELLGRSGRRIGGRDGVGFVLKSLPENARNLYRILIAEQLAASIDADEDLMPVDEDQGFGQAKDDIDASGDAGIEYRLLYHKAREELVCSTEHQFRTLLKEFYDHQMVESRRDGLGAERLIVPWRRDELEGLLEELVE